MLYTACFNSVLADCPASLTTSKYLPLSSSLGHRYQAASCSGRESVREDSTHNAQIGGYG